jgi:hypothetical protein
MRALLRPLRLVVLLAALMVLTHPRPSAAWPTCGDFPDCLTFYQYAWEWCQLNSDTGMGYICGGYCVNDQCCPASCSWEDCQNHDCGEMEPSAWGDFQCCFG